MVVMMSKCKIARVFVTCLLALPISVVLSQVAEAKNVLSCEGPVRQSVIVCCQAIVREQGMPDWMKNGRITCPIVVSCGPQGAGQYCRAQYRVPASEAAGRRK